MVHDATEPIKKLQDTKAGVDQMIERQDTRNY